jgi:hypothetical protein
MEKFTEYYKESDLWEFRNDEETQQRKYLRIWDDQVQLVENKKNLYKKWLSTKKLEDKIEYKKEQLPLQ